MYQLKKNFKHVDCPLIFYYTQKQSTIQRLSELNLSQNPYVLLKALLPVCMKYTARDESRVANIARGEAECYICHKTLIKSCILSYKRSGSVLLYFTLI